MVAFGRIRERLGKTPEVAKHTDVLPFQWNSKENLEVKWMKRVKLMRQVGTTSLGNDARETLTIAGLERAKERNLEQHLVACTTDLGGVIYNRGSVSEYDNGLKLNTAHADGHQRVVSTCACCGRSGHEKPTCQMRNEKLGVCGKGWTAKEDVQTT